jgi:hypothetical protein
MDTFSFRLFCMKEMVAMQPSLLQPLPAEGRAASEGGIADLRAWASVPHPSCKTRLAKRARTAYVASGHE